MVARWGGEEFVLALTSTDEDGGLIVANRVRLAIEELDIRDVDGSRIPVTASVGLARYEQGDSLEVLVDRADRAMYGAKTSGRNRVVVATSAREAPESNISPSKENAA
jgi:diguanylate cyclase (GGDEF)-like protein